MKNSNLARRLAVVAGLSVASGGAMATTCDELYSQLATCASGGSCYYPTYAETLAYFQSQHPSCFGTSSESTTQLQVTQTSINMMQMISQNLGNRLLAAGGPIRTASAPAGRSGLAAGSAAAGWNAWGSYAADEAGYKVNGLAVAGAPGTPFNIDNLNNVDTLTLGGDYRIKPSMVVGLSFALDAATGYVNPTTNVANSRSQTSGRGQSLAAYVGWQLDKNWALDATVGAGFANSSPAPRTTVDSKRRFAGVNATYANWIGNWQLNGKAGYQFGAEEFENARRGVALPLTGYTARLGQVRIGGEVGYWMADGVMPFVGVAYVNDVSRNTVRVKQLWEDDAVVLSAGINFFSLKNSLSGGIVYTDETSRNFVRHSNWMANINYRF